MKLIKSSAITSIVSIILGLLLNIIISKNLIIGEYPSNIYVGLGLLTSIIFLNILANKKMFHFLNSYELAIASILNIIFIVLILGLVPQDGLFLPSIGISKLKDSFLTHISIFLFLFVLSVVIRKSLNKGFNIRNIAFIMNHLGIFILVFAIYIGNSDIKKIQLKINEKADYVDKGIDATGKLHNLPFKIRLNEFDISEYSPQIALVEAANNKVSIEIENNLSHLENSYEREILKWNVKVIHLIPYAVFNGIRFKKSTSEGAAPAAFLELRNTETDERKTGWISCGSEKVPLSYMKISDKYNLMMIKPKIREFISRVDIISTTDSLINKNLKVNHPINIGYWDIYQLSYDVEKGKWSTYSIIEAVYDPWIRYVYTGIFMLILGSFILLKKRIY